MAHISGNQTTTTLRRCLDVSLWSALRAAAHGAKPVLWVAAQSAARRVSASSPALDGTQACVKAGGFEFKVFAGRGLRPRMSFVTAPAVAPEAETSDKAKCKLQSPFGAVAPCPVGGFNQGHARAQAACFAGALANQSLNRTLHGMPGFGPPFHSGPNPVLPFRAG